MYVKTTRNMKVLVVPAYVEEQSIPADNHYVWAYAILIENRGAEEVQLLRRHWHITDARGQAQEVRGDGVVGEQPVIAAGEQFRYTSGVNLTTPSGIMVGSYTMVETATGQEFDIAVPAFSLDCPYQVVRPH